MFVTKVVRFCLLAGCLWATVYNSFGQREALNTEGADIIAAAGEVSLSSKAATVTLKASVAGARTGSFAERLNGLRENQHIFLVLRDVIAVAPPGVIFGVYLNLPGGVEPEDSRRYLVGSLNFFGLTGPTPGWRSFDITELVKELKNHNLLTEAPVVTIRAPAVPVAGANAKIGRVEIVEHPI
jgi:hypothetical protein